MQFHVVRGAAVESRTTRRVCSSVRRCIDVPVLGQTQEQADCHASHLGERLARRSPLEALQTAAADRQTGLPTSRPFRAVRGRVTRARACG